MQISDDLVSNFKETWTQLMNQMIHEVVINDTHLHRMKKLNAMMNQDYKELYHLERTEHEWTKSRQGAPTNPGYGYFTGLEESVIYPTEINTTIRVCSDYSPPYDNSSPIDTELRRSAFHRPSVNRIDLDAPIWE